MSSNGSVLLARKRALLRPNYPRTKTGCLTCRRRRKKCDETRPDCTGCRRNGLACTWPAKDAKGSDSGRTRRPPSRSSSAAAVVGTDRPQQLDHGSCLTSGSDEFMSSSPVVAGTIASSATLCSFTGPHRGAFITPVSADLLAHYVRHTAGLLAARSLQDSPFLGHILPLAYTDDLIMHCILALGGVHLQARDSNAMIVAGSWTHYASALRALRLESAKGLQNNDREQIIHLLLALVLISHVEVSSEHAWNSVAKGRILAYP